MRRLILIIFFLLPGLLTHAKTSRLIPTATFTATTVCQGLPTVFTNNSTTLSGSIVANIWDFGDGEGSSVSGPKHTYASSGTFTVTLTVINSSGEVDDFSSTVTVHPSGNLNFQISSTNKCVSSAVTFTNFSNIIAGNFTSFTWNFGDGGNVGTTNATHQYANHGTYTVTLGATTDHNCTVNFSQQFEVYPEATPDFNAAEVCHGTATQFINTTQVATGLVAYVWNFNDAATSSEINPSHLYANPGSYNVNLKATTEKGCITNTSKQVNVNPQPVSEFSVSDHCFGVNATFTNQSTVTSGVLGYTWNFGDGNNSNSTSPSHLYNTVGNFQVTLQALSSKGCQASVSKHLYVSPKPIVDFSFKDVCFGQKAEFFNSTTIAEGQLTYIWNFGDTQTSASINPIHEFGVYGSYDVNLQATTSQGGCTDNITKTIKINQQPVASFTVNDDCLDKLIQFNNSSVYSGVDILYNWQFGDGKSATAVSPNHQYTSAQTYTVTLKAESLNGCSSSVILPVQVFPLPIVNFSTENICDNQASTFKNFSSISSGSMNFTWDFGDTGTSSDSDPIHTYQTHGNYTVKVSAVSDAGCTAIREKPVSVYPLPVPDFLAPPVCDSQPVEFSNTSTIASGSISTNRWDFGDQTNSIVKNPTKEFMKEGTYLVKLYTTSDQGCEQSVEKNVSVYPAPMANFSVNDVCAKESILTSNTSTIASGSLSYYWNFGDNTNSIATSPSHNYSQYGVYNIKLVATSNQGCKDSVKHAVAIFSLPTVKAGPDQTVSEGYSANLLASGGIDYRWEPIDGLDNSSIPDPHAKPLTTTEYIVFSKDKYGCENSDTVTVFVEHDFKLVVSNVLTPDENGKNDAWVIENIETFGAAHVRVYNRWGKLVFEEEAYQNDWRGKSGGDVLPDGTYYYYVTFEDSDKDYKGALTILRNRK